MNQHLVSRVLLRQWENTRNGGISSLDLQTYEEKTDSIKKFGSIEDLVTQGTEELEQVWSNEVEKKLNHPFKLVKDGTILELSNSQHLDYIKDCMALHWARSFTITVILRAMMPQYADQIATSMLRTYTPTQGVKELTGLYVTGFGAEDVFRQKIYEEFDKNIQNGFLKEQFNTHYAEAKKRMQANSLEICHASASEFVLSDCPVVTWDKARNIAGVLYGAAWTDADSIFMAINPKYVVALSKVGKYRELNEGEVVQINKLQVMAAYKEIFYRTGCGLGEKISKALQDTQAAQEKAK